jgi:hypothetical protein
VCRAVPALAAAPHRGTGRPTQPAMGHRPTRTGPAQVPRPSDALAPAPCGRAAGSGTRAVRRSSAPQRALMHGCTHARTRKRTHAHDCARTHARARAHRCLRCRAARSRRVHPPSQRQSAVERRRSAAYDAARCRLWPMAAWQIRLRQPQWTLAAAARGSLGCGSRWLPSGSRLIRVGRVLASSRSYGPSWSRHGRLMQVTHATAATPAGCWLCMARVRIWAV